MKTINIVLFGPGKVGSRLIRQILEIREDLQRQEQLQLELPVIANTTTAFFAKAGLNPSWEADFKEFGFPYKLDDILEYVSRKKYKNLVAVDATASETFPESYPRLVQAGFHIIAANKAANSRSSAYYLELRQLLREQEKFFLYETNVGAGLPLIQTLKELHQAGEKINRLRGVFSGSLSYIFNRFSTEDKKFSAILSAAEQKGLTEPDPRMDLSGKDVARKLLILARELGLRKELEEVEIQDLVPPHLNGNTSLAQFRKRRQVLDSGFEALKNELQPDEVIRHVGELDLHHQRLSVGLVKEKKDSALGSLSGADSSFEIYSQSYADRPLVIQGAGAGVAVTARGLLSDLLKLAGKLS